MNKDCIVLEDVLNKIRLNKDIELITTSGITIAKTDYDNVDSVVEKTGDTYIYLYKNNDINLKVNLRAIKRVTVYIECVEIMIK